MEILSPDHQMCLALPRAYRKGDANFDNNVDISDVLSVVNFVLESDFPTAEEFRNVDVNEDEQINIADVIKVVDIIFGVNSMRASWRKFSWTSKRESIG